MKRSHSKAELSSDDEEPLDAAGNTFKRTQSLELKPQSVQGWGNDGEGSSIQGASGVALQSTQASLGLESCSFQDLLRDAIQANRGVAAQPTEAGSGLESHSFQEQPNVEELAIQAGSYVAIQLTQAGSRPESLNFEEQPDVEEGCTQYPISGAVVQSMQAGLGLECQNFQEQPNNEERGGVGLQSTQVVLPGPLIQGDDTLQTLTDKQRCLIGEFAHFATCSTISPRDFQAGTPHPEEETGSNDGSMPQTPAFVMDDLGDDHVETSHEEEEKEGEEAGIHDSIGLESPIIDTEFLRSIGWPMDAEEDIVIQARAGEQEMPGLDEPMDDEADIGIQVPASRKCMVETDIEVLDSIDVIDGTLQFLTAGASHSHKETSGNDGNMPKTSPSDMKDLRNSPDEMSHQEGAGLNDRIGPQACPADLNKPMDDEEDVAIQAQAGQQQVPGLDEPVDDEEDSGIQVRAGQQQMQDGPSQQGTAGRRMRLQVPLCGAEGPIEQTVFRLPQVRELACLVKCI